MLAALGALLIGLSLGLLGSGGSILTVPILAFLVGEPAKLAIAESLSIVGIIAGIGAINHGRLRHIDWRSVLLVGPPSMMGSFAGAWVSQWISGHVQLLLFSMVMLVAGYRMYQSSRDEAEPQTNYCRPGCMLGVGVGLGIHPDVVKHWRKPSTDVWSPTHCAPNVCLRLTSLHSSALSRRFVKQVFLFNAQGDTALLPTWAFEPFPVSLESAIGHLQWNVCNRRGFTELIEHTNRHSIRDVEVADSSPVTPTTR